MRTKKVQKSIGGGKMKKNKKQEEDYSKYLYIGIMIAIILGLVGFLLMQIFNLVYQDAIQEGTQTGINIAEANCLKLICNQTGCEQLEKIDYVQKYCKSIVYGTDFYLRYGK